MSSTLLESLVERLQTGDVVVVVGAGVSIGATNGSSLASWTGLLEDGVAHCEEVAEGLAPD